MLRESLSRRMLPRKASEAVAGIRFSLSPANLHKKLLFRVTPLHSVVLWACSSRGWLVAWLLGWHEEMSEGNHLKSVFHASCILTWKAALSQRLPACTTNRGGSVFILIPCQLESRACAHSALSSAKMGVKRGRAVHATIQVMVTPSGRLETGCRLCSKLRQARMLRP